MTPTASARPILAPDPASRVDPLPAPPSFSCVIAARQVADLIGDAIDSLLDQTHPPLEVIVVDDGSTDDLQGAVRGYGERVTLVRREHGGAAAAFNTGIAAASGDYVCFIGADDVFAPERLQALGELAAARPDLDVLTTDAWISLHGEVFRRFNDHTHPFEVGNQRQAILERNFVFGHTAVLREKLLAVGGFDESIRWTSDWELWARMVLGGSSIGSVDEPLATYRLHERAMSTKRLQQARGRIVTHQRILGHPSLTPTERAAVEQRLAAIHREVRWGEAKEALLEGAADGRARCRRVLADRGQPSIVRRRALIAVVLPAIARMMLKRQQRQEWTAAGGLRVRRS